MNVATVPHFADKNVAAMQRFSVKLLLSGILFGSALIGKVYVDEMDM